MESNQHRLSDPESIRNHRGPALCLTVNSCSDLSALVEALEFSTSTSYHKVACYLRAGGLDCSKNKYAERFFRALCSLNFRKLTLENIHRFPISWLESIFRPVAQENRLRVIAFEKVDFFVETEQEIGDLSCAITCFEPHSSLHLSLRSCEFIGNPSKNHPLQEALLVEQLLLAPSLLHVQCDDPRNAYFPGDSLFLQLLRYGRLAKLRFVLSSSPSQERLQKQLDVLTTAIQRNPSIVRVNLSVYESLEFVIPYMKNLFRQHHPKDNENNNISKVRELTVCIQNTTAENALLEVIEGLAEATDCHWNIVRLRFVNPPVIQTMNSTIQMALVSMLESNYFLQTLDVQGFHNDDVYFNFLLQLNQHGKRDFLKRSGSGTRNDKSSQTTGLDVTAKLWVEALSESSSDLSCLYYLLRLNPLICCN